MPQYATPPRITVKTRAALDYIRALLMRADPSRPYPSYDEIVGMAADALIAQLEESHDAGPDRPDPVSNRGPVL